ncbi:hypothetical protein FHQ28_12440 [Pasteurellaceae bacterium USgator11]|nr:hypothetical protein FHQ20_10100 [Pasteurellaceae bacterium USgator41]TNG92710.1 hypothetical protein FHQ19_11865 [Pasteurellaceae bacterium UScroc12]TNG95916.1 hypothetical protein FHQ24_12310 [Pasteurellaceae bacterium UScroc31]TNG98141.1 hypothetical protein FHQ28_12440 [Pasteurellaceae bacterium USgator11]
MTEQFTTDFNLITKALSRTPMVLLRYQQVWCADSSPVKVCEKSRRIGLTWSEAADSALLAAKVNGMDTWYVGYNKDMALEFIRDCANWAKFYGLAAGEIEETEEVFKAGKEEESILAFTIRFASGWRITALSSSPSNLRGKQGRIIIDEAAFHPCLSELLKAAMALLMWGGQVHIISTHDGVDNPFNELIQEIREEKKPYSLHTITFKDALEDGLYERICLRTGKTYTKASDHEWEKKIRAFYGDDAEEELDCVPKNSGGKWLSRTLIESQMNAYTPLVQRIMKSEFELVAEPQRRKEINDWLDEEIKPLLEKLDQTQRHFVGEDFARSGDLTSITISAEQTNLTNKVRFIVELGNMPYKQQEQIVLYILNGLPLFSGAAFDARGNGGYLAEAARDKYGSELIHLIMLSEKWYRENTAPFKAALEDGTFTDIPKHADVLSDLRSFEIIRGVPRIPDIRVRSIDGKSKRHGDTGIALLLLHYATRQLVLLPVKAYSSKPRQSKKITEGY